MYNPSSFRQDDPDILADFINAHPFATLVSHSETGPEASHLPLIFDRERHAISGHFAKANSHWERLDGQSVLAIFHGPHAYISPLLYDEPNTVPTWNYQVVHVRGTLTLLEDEGTIVQSLERMAALFEAGNTAAWTLDVPDEEFLQKLLPMIVPFEIAISDIEGKWKLSQNHSQQRLAGVIAGLRKRGTGDDQAIAEAMESLEKSAD